MGALSTANTNMWFECRQQLDGKTLMTHLYNRLDGM